MMIKKKQQQHAWLWLEPANVIYVWAALLQNVEDMERDWQGQKNITQCNKIFYSGSH